MGNYFSKYFQKSKVAAAVCAVLAAALALGPGAAVAQTKGAKPAPAAPAAKAADAKAQEAARAPSADRKAVPPAAPAPAAAATTTNAASIGEPTDAIITSGDNIAVVQPVFMVGQGSDAAWRDLAASVHGKKAGAAGAAEIGKLQIDAPKKVAKEANQFAGSSAAADIAVLQQSVALGFIPALVISGKTDAAKALAQKLAGNLEVLEGLSEDARKSAMVFIALGLAEKEAEGKLIGMIFGMAMRSGMVGIATGPQRGHGYYVAGVWSGMAMMFASIGGKHETFADIAEPICVLLDKDAQFGGSDRTIAAHMRKIAEELRKETPDVGVVRGEVGGILAVKADEPKAP